MEERGGGGGEGEGGGHNRVTVSKMEGMEMLHS